MLAQAETFAQRAAEFAIRRATARQMTAAIQKCSKQMARE
jgi:hypothetical protein